MTDLGHASTCQCSSGTAVDTPRRIDNAPGLPAIAHRVGSHSSFKRSILARLSGRPVPALAGLGARTDDDFTIALADGFAVMADVLTFYQERIANEAYLRTATERRSVLELARLLGYQLDPGLAADAWLAFRLDEPRGGAPPTMPGTSPPRTKVQSVPGPDEAPQTFETVAPIDARVERNAIAVQAFRPQRTFRGQRELVLEGTGHQLTPGDIILVVGSERLRYHIGENWDVRLLRTVEVDDDRQLTRVTWLEGLGSESPLVEPAKDQVHVYVFRQRASLFGHNAPDPRLLAQNTQLPKLANIAYGTWKNFDLSGTAIDLDQAYPKVVPGGWVALVSDDIRHAPSSLPGYAELYHVDAVAYPSVAAFGLSSKVTRITLDSAEHLDWYGRRETLVLAQTDELPLADLPIRSPLYGDRIPLASLVPDLTKGQPLAISGRRQHILVGPATKGLSLDLVDGSAVPLRPGDRLALLAPPTKSDGAGGQIPLDPDELAAALDPLAPAASAPLRWQFEDRDGRAGWTEAPASAFRLDPAGDDDPSYAEIVAIGELSDAVVDDRDRTHLRLAGMLSRPYDRETVRINANVAPATHGETVNEVLGNGDAAKRDQRMTLKQAPLTYVGADTPSGNRTTLEVRVDDLLWPERATLFEATPRDRVHITRIADGGATTVAFGDGVEGARLPTGQANVRARYRKGLGAAGNVRAGQLTTLLSRPLGVTSVVNPRPATGGEDPERLEDARANAPRTVLTLGRAVSRLDYEDFARGFAGIAKAHAAWIATGPARGVVVTIAGPAGAAVLPGDPTYLRLVRALRKAGDELLLLVVLTYRAATFRLSVDVKFDDASETEPTLAAVRSALEGAFAFDARGFGQRVSIDEVAAVVHRVKGVLAVDVNILRRSDQSMNPAVRPRLLAGLPVVSGRNVSAAELLTLDATTLVVGLMP